MALAGGFIEEGREISIMSFISIYVSVITMYSST